MGEEFQTGGCQCGQLRYRCPAEPIDIYICHCTECRAQSSSAFGISVGFASASIEFSGKTRSWTRPTPGGGTLECVFCPECGSRVWHGSLEREESVSIKGGSLDEPVDISNAIHIWVNSKLPGVAIPEGATQFGEEPE